MTAMSRPKAGRNEPCSCGSGKKFKQCCYQRTTAARPDYAVAHYNLGNSLLAQGKLVLAIENYRRALIFKPDYAEAYNNMGAALQAQGEQDSAIQCFRRALELKPDHAQACNNLGGALLGQGKLSEAVESFRRALQIKPDYFKACSNLGNALQEQGRVDEAVESHRRALALEPDFTEAYSNLLFALAIHAACTPAQYLEEARCYGSMLAARAKPFTSWNVRKSPPLRVGLVSGDLGAHPVGFFLESILAHLNPDRIELLAYSTSWREDDLTSRIKPNFIAWHSIAGLDDETAARKIHQDGVHILIDLTGHTAQNRLPVFAWKPAPVQVSWLGYFASTGVPGMDYLLADPISVPESERKDFTETIWHLPDTRLCFTPPSASVKLALTPLPAMRHGHVTFGSFQNLAKINDEVLALWGRILKALPQACLRLQNRQMGSPEEQEYLKHRLAQAGINPERTILETPDSRENYLAAHASVDIILDTFPYPGGTTTCESLWMGVPTLTLKGDTLLARQGASLLACAGLDEWIASDKEDYLARALHFAGDIEGLAQLRRNLRQQVTASPLIDAHHFALNLQHALESMWLERKTK